VYLGIDVGMAGVKAVLVNESGAIIARWRRMSSAPSWLLEITERVVRRIQPQPGSGRQELLQSIATATSGGCAEFKPHRIVREESS
jgi:predicted NBD/HSP70 family sugar kinase